MTTFRIGLALVLASSLSGCLGSGSGVSGTKEEFDTAFLDLAAMGLATTPLAGSATYSGEMQVVTLEDGDHSGSIRGALELTADFDAARPFSATVSDFSGEIAGEQVTFSGTLSSDQATGSTPINALLVTALPAVAGDRETTAMELSLGGTLTNDSTGVKNVLQSGTNMVGNFYGTNGQAVGGATGWTIIPEGGTSAITGTSYGSYVGGQWYAER